MKRTELSKREKYRRKGSKVKRPWFMREKYDGRGLLMLGATLLLLLSGYEFYIRLDDFSRMIESVQYLSRVKGESFAQNLFIFMEAPSMTELRHILYFLSACIVLALLSLILANRPRAGIIIILADIAVFMLGFAMDGVAVFTFSGLIQFIKFMPILMIFAGAAVNICEKCMKTRYDRKCAALASADHCEASGRSDP